jgi:hypothetical protein
MTDTYIPEWDCRADAVIRHPELGRVKAIVAYLYEVARAHRPEDVVIRADDAGGNSMSLEEKAPPLVADEAKEEEQLVLKHVMDEVRKINARLDEIDAQRRADRASLAALLDAEEDPDAAFSRLEPAKPRRVLAADADGLPSVAEQLHGLRPN